MRTPYLFLLLFCSVLISLNGYSQNKIGSLASGDVCAGAGLLPVPQKVSLSDQHYLLDDSWSIDLTINRPEDDPSVFPGVGDPNYLATPQIVMCTTEAYFLRAEGALLGWNMDGSVQELYESGITNSMIQWGITNSIVISDYVNSIVTPVAPDDYLNSPPMTNIAVNFNTSDVNVQMEQIATQKWLALFPDGMEAWVDFRRSHILKLYFVANSENLDLTNTTTQWIRRIPFLTSEKQNNGAEVEKAVALLGGSDKITTPLWWDMN